MKITREDVTKVAALANLELTDAEVETFRGQLDDILTYIDKLNEIDTTNIEPMAQVLETSAGASEKVSEEALGTASEEASEKYSALRDDVVSCPEILTEVLDGAPDPAYPYFRVPRVIEK